MSYHYRAKKTRECVHDIFIMLWLFLGISCTCREFRWCYLCPSPHIAWWRHQMETFSALLALFAGNSPVTGKFPSQRLVTQSIDIFFDMRLKKQLSKQLRRWWFEMPSRSLWLHCNGLWDFESFCIYLIQWGLRTPYGFLDLGKHWFRYGVLPWRHLWPLLLSLIPACKSN